MSALDELRRTMPVKEAIRGDEELKYADLLGHAVVELNDKVDKRFDRLEGALAAAFKAGAEALANGKDHEEQG